MLRLAGEQVESLFDELLPVEVRELPAELAVLDRLLADPRLLAPIERTWERSARGHGRPTIPMGSFVRLMVIKQRTGWGYETLVREVSDSLPSAPLELRTRPIDDLSELDAERVVLDPGTRPAFSTMGPPTNSPDQSHQEAAGRPAQRRTR
jgi:hypothetical protein